MDEVLDKPRHANQTPPALTKQRQDQFLRMLSQTGQLRATCTALALDTSTPYNWASRSERFAKRFEDAKAAGEKVLLDAYEEKVDERAFTGQSDPQSAVLTMFRMKRLDPRYRDNAVVQVNASGPVAMQLNFNAPMQTPQAETQAEDGNRVNP